MKGLFVILFLIQSISLSFQYSSFFNHWHCIGIKEKIDVLKPYKAYVGDLPLVLWQNPVNHQWSSSINICKHMGSALDNGKITESGCLKCQYHGLEFSHEDRFGEIAEHEGKLFWAYKPVTLTPPSIPFFGNPKYATSFLEIDMEASLTDSAYNTMDLRHPEYVHNQLVGFGNTIPPTNIKHHLYPNQPDRVGLSFDYVSNRVMRSINDNTRHTKNFHMYVYPTFTWSKVSFGEKHLIIGVHLLPLAPKKTRWYVTLCHNYYTSDMGKPFMKALAFTILSQDYTQMKNQHPENELKRALLFGHVFKDEDPILFLHRLFKDYTYPDIASCVELYQDYSNNK